ncbi:MAG: hypothetical protein JJU12_08600 [Chlamydiales bacterium]|nr:hypothetical protein [Chlamydiales bacterium]
MSRKTIGESPFDTVVPPKRDEEKLEPVQPQTKLNGHSLRKPTPNENAKQRLTVQISEDVIERAKNAVYWTRGLTLAQLTENALEQALANLEGSSVIYDENGNQLKRKGDEFPQRKEDLKSGRPVK